MLGGVLFEGCELTSAVAAELAVVPGGPVLSVSVTSTRIVTPASEGCSV